VFVALTLDDVASMGLADGFIRRCEATASASVDAALAGELTDERFVQRLVDDAIAAESIDPFAGVDLTRGVIREIVRDATPLGLVGGCVVQNYANPSRCHEAIAGLVHGVHAWHVGAGLRERNHAVMFGRLLDSLAIDVPALHSARFARDLELAPTSWALPAYYLSLAQFPDGRALEALGAMLFEVTAPLAGLLRGLEPRLRELGASLDYLGNGAGPGLAAARTSALEAARQALAESGAAGRRAFARGFLTARALFTAWRTELLADLARGRSTPAAEMLRLVQRKAKHAAAYHRDVQLGPHDFRELLADPEKFVEGLAHSSWIKPGHPEASLLLTDVIKFGGPMFRIFSEEEIGVIEAWIRSLAPEAAARPASAPRPVARAVTPPRASASTERRRVALPPVRDLYHQLLNLERFPDAPAAALEYATTWLARSAQGLERAPAALPFARYSHEELYRHFEERYAMQVGDYAPAGDAAITKSRADVIAEAVGLVPMILIDGGWLRRWGSAGLVESRIGALLYKIYSDEIGNGDPVLNHPNVYRDLIREMGVELPPHTSEAFAHSTLFDDRDFLVPTFWLSISMFPRRFLPETLGLNAAMELSGVGGSYRTAKDELVHHGFSAQFVELHDTIDNVSSGHTAMAIRAIELHLDGLMRAGDPAIVDAHWRRVWTGFRALVPPTPSWKERLVRPRYPH
jgi:hypothetical protein